MPWGVYAQVALLIYGFYIVWTWQGNSVKLPSSAQARAVLTSQPVYGLLPPSSDFFTPTPAVKLTPTPQATPQATPTLVQAVPVAQPTDYAPVMVFRYSYYNPALGGVNCYAWNDITQTCDSTLANGEDWRENYGRAVACAPEIAFGSVIDVIYPAQLAGKWLCKDRGGAIVGDYIDFLDVAQRYDWSALVVARVSAPALPIEEINSGSH